MKWCVPAAAWLLCDLLIVLAVQDVGPRRGVLIAAAGMLLALTVAAAVVLLFRRAAVAITLAALGFSAFTLTATANAPEHQVKQVYTAWLQAHADADAQRICDLTDPDDREEDCVYSEQNAFLRNNGREVKWAREWARLDVVDVEVDGDQATATLRAGRCTLNVFRSDFQRGEDGRWRYAHGSATAGFDPYCQERGVEPPRLAG